MPEICTRDLIRALIATLLAPIFRPARPTVNSCLTGASAQTVCSIPIRTITSPCNWNSSPLWTPHTHHFQHPRSRTNFPASGYVAKPVKMPRLTEQTLATFTFYMFFVWVAAMMIACWAVEVARMFARRMAREASAPPA